MLAAGCGGGSDGAAKTTSTPTTPRPPAVSGPALCGRLAARIVGRVRNDDATELSGLVASRSQANVLWTHNDSADAPRVLAFAPDGRLRADLQVTGAEAVDWEAISIAPGASGGGVLYLGDIGDNAEQREEIVVYSVPEVRLLPGVAGRGATAPAQRLALRYPDGSHDAEALIVDGATGALLIVTKDFGGDAGVYLTRRRATRGTVTLRRAGTLSLGLGSAITDGAISADGSTVVLRTYDRAYVFSRNGGEPLTRTLRRRPCVADADLGAEGQGEALAVTGDGRAFFTVPEGRHPAIRRYAPAK